MTISLDFSSLPLLETAPSTGKFPADLALALNRFPETASRCQGATHFAYLLSRNNEPVASVSDDRTRRESYLRAALCEFGSMNDFAIEEAGVTMTNSVQPLVHIIRLLRHVNVHVQSSGLLENRTTAVWPRASSGGFDHEFDLVIWLIEDRCLRKVLEVRDARHYSTSDLHRMIEWFAAAQESWGAGDLIRRAAEAFGWEVAKSARTV